MTTTKGSWQAKAGLNGVDNFTNSGTYEQILFVSVGDIEVLRIRGTTSALLSGMKVTKALAYGQTHSDYFVDADLDAPMNKLPSTSKTAAGASLYLTPAAGSFEFEIDVSTLMEIGLWVKSGSDGTITWSIKGED